MTRAEEYYMNSREEHGLSVALDQMLIHLIQ